MEVCFKCKEVIKENDKFITATELKSTGDHKYHLECYEKLKEKEKIWQFSVAGIVVVFSIILLISIL